MSRLVDAIEQWWIRYMGYADADRWSDDAFAREEEDELSAHIRATAESSELLDPERRKRLRQRRSGRISRGGPPHPRGPDAGGGAGVREPRRPPPGTDDDAIALPPPDDEAA